MQSQTHTQKLKIVVVGHVDHGKSTLIGRIFYDTDALPDGKIESIQKACEAEGMPFEYAFLLDALLEEQAQNITIDTTQIPFRTQQRGYVIIDAPGHTEFLKNMVTGAASADAALLLIDASEGVREQSRRHAYLLSILGVKQVAVVVNKMDLAHFEQGVYDRIVSEYTEFLTTIGVRAERFIPVSARGGDNVARKSEAMPWYDGPTVLEALDTFSAPATEADLPLRLPLQDVYRFDNRRILAGRIESGTLHEGDLLQFAPGNKTARVRTIERWQGKHAPYAVAGESVGITLDEQLFVERGHTAFLAGDGESAPLTVSSFRANLFWMGTDGPLTVGQNFKLKLATQETDATVVSVERVWDAGTLALAAAPDTVNRNDVAEITLQTRTPLTLDAHANVPNLGRFVLVQNRRVAGGGIVLGAVNAPPPETPLSQNLVWSHDPVSLAEREARSGHKSLVVWLTGLSGSGKSTVAQIVSRALFEKGWQATLLDGDNLRQGLNSDLGFTEADRGENNRRAAHVAALLAAQGGQIVLASFISPTQESRNAARRIAEGAGVGFLEVFADAALADCEARDPKGLYQKARAGQIADFTGIDAPYEKPASPDVRLQTGSESPQDSAQTLMAAIGERARL